VLEESSDTGAETIDANGNGAYMDGYGYGSGSGSSCGSSTSTSADTYPYANFYQIRLEQDEITLNALTAVSSEANAVCLTESCKKFYGPAPAEYFALTLQPSTGMLVFLHPLTSDWWQCDTNIAIKRWVRNDGTVGGRNSNYRDTIPTGFSGVVYTASKLYVVGGGYRDAPNSWSNNVAPGDGESTEIGNSMELDFVSGQWLDLDSSRKITGIIYGSCNDEISCPITPDRSFCASPSSSAGYMDGGSGSTANGTKTCQPCWNYEFLWDCESSFTSDREELALCISLCINNVQAATGSSTSPATLRYGHGMAEGPPGTLLVVFGGTSGNLDNTRPMPQTNENREITAGQFAGVINAKNDLYVFGNNKKWSEATVEDTNPESRSFFGFSSMPSTDGTYILFGGFALKRLPELADTWKLTIRSSNDAWYGTWKAMIPNGASPSGRVGLGLVAGRDGKIHLFGGGRFDWTKIDSGSLLSLPL